MTRNPPTKEAVRPAAVAGQFYPAGANVLRSTVQRLMDRPDLQLLANVRAFVAPHAGYVCSGPVAGAAFRMFQGLRATDRIVYLLGPSHHAALHGVALSSTPGFATPLGIVPVAVHRVAMLAATRFAYIDDQAHAPEHCLEVELPFLQVLLAESFAIVPMLCDADADLSSLAEHLATQLAINPEAVIVVSSDLSHHRSYEDAARRDHALLDAIAAGHMHAVAQGAACGMGPILCLMQIAHQMHWQPHVIAYANSGDTCGSRHKVVGYGAVAFTGS